MIMTQEQKELLLKDLSARLPYGVVIQEEFLVHDEMFLPDAENDRIINIDVDTETLITNGWSKYYIDDVRPYLFPLSGMTEEQKKELQSLMIRDSYGILYHTIDSFDYLYKNHIDIRGLIEKGLAIDATGLNIYKI